MITDTAPVARSSRRARRPSVKAQRPRHGLATEAKHGLKPLALAADASASTEISLSLLWRELGRGVSKVVATFFSEERCYLVLSVRTDAVAAPIEGRRLEILEAVLSGLRQKNIAIDLALAPSTVALNSRLALENIGVDGKPSRAHPLLMLAARAVSKPECLFGRCSTLGSSDQGELRVVSTPRPDLKLSRQLPSAERAVIRNLIEGLSYREIARLRGTSTRTIANQISAVFRRLRVSGRNELVQRLFFDDGLTKFGAPAREPPALPPPPAAMAARRSA